MEKPKSLVCTSCGDMKSLWSQIRESIKEVESSVLDWHFIHSISDTIELLQKAQTLVRTIHPSKWNLPFCLLKLVCEFLPNTEILPLQQVSSVWHQLMQSLRTQQQQKKIIGFHRPLNYYHIMFDSIHIRVNRAQELCLLIHADTVFYDSNKHTQLVVLAPTTTTPILKRDYSITISRCFVTSTKICITYKYTHDVFVYQRCHLLSSYSNRLVTTFHRPTLSDSSWFSEDNCFYGLCKPCGGVAALQEWSGEWFLCKKIVADVGLGGDLCGNESRLFCLYQATRKTNTFPYRETEYGRLWSFNRITDASGSTTTSRSSSFPPSSVELDVVPSRTTMCCNSSYVFIYDRDKYHVWIFSSESLLMIGAFPFGNEMNPVLELAAFEDGLLYQQSSSRRRLYRTEFIRV